eukprot:10722567-Lingulodinium_polyedra.AAC.1
MLAALRASDAPPLNVGLGAQSLSRRWNPKRCFNWPKGHLALPDLCEEGASGPHLAAGTGFPN